MTKVGLYAISTSTTLESNKSLSCLYEAVAQILTRFGTDYTIAFQAA